MLRRHNRRLNNGGPRRLGNFRRIRNEDHLCGNGPATHFRAQLRAVPVKHGDLNQIGLLFVVNRFGDAQGGFQPFRAVSAFGANELAYP
ncbi:hypothetical protein C241_18555 [Bradyrhizobium lupini HPC(L)]|uniref:Uncharacterized protein n=1 Tax=Bradyrhizobium lupini HPC(L) TaxID=1229491 RepID=A0ABN0HIR5_RHILU|nr:hypothetical protein C241_18555 [Bradyrhizobium lupini HPC(L)]